jgi:hypothetical protein
MRFALVLVGVVVLAGSGSCGQQKGPLPNVAEVDITVTTTFGEPAGKVLVILRGVGARDRYDQTGTAIRFKQIPFGLYDLEIQAAGFSTRHDQVGIYQQSVQLWFGIYPSPTHAVEPSEVQGSVALKEGDTRALWARLVPLYSSDFIEDRVSPSGDFHFAGLYPGRYVLLVIDGDKVLLTKSVDYFGGKLKLQVDVARGN